MSIYQDLSDFELWEIFRAGDKNPLEFLYLRHYDLLLNYGLKFIKDEELVKDAIHDLFVKLYIKQKIDSTISVRAYLLKSLRNLLYDMLNTFHEISIEQIEYEFSIVDAEIENLYKKSDIDVVRSKKLINALAKLNGNQKMILYLRYIKELSYKEIAEILNINEQSSMNLVFRT